MDAQKKTLKMKEERIKAYNEPSKIVIEATEKSQKRVNERKKQSQQIFDEENTVDVDKQQYEILIGQLKAAEARNRLRIMRMRYESIMEREVNHLISCQPTALRAVRLEAMLPTRSKAGTKPSAAATTETGASGSAGGLTSEEAAETTTDVVGFAERLTKLDQSRIERLLSD